MELGSSVFFLCVFLKNKSGFSRAMVDPTMLLKPGSIILSKTV